MSYHSKLLIFSDMQTVEAAPLSIMCSILDGSAHSVNDRRVNMQSELPIKTF